jgi:NADH-quinone oxidoreductase subunit N
MKALLLVSGLGFLGILSEILNFKKFIYKLSIVGLLVAIVVTFLEWDNPTPAYFNNMVYFDNLAISFIAVLLITGLLWFLMAESIFENDGLQSDKSTLVLFSIVGAICMVAYNNITMLFIGIEILSICMYVLAGSKKESLGSNESAMKYFLMGAFATGFLLMGIAFIYGASASFDVMEIKAYMSNSPQNIELVYTGIILLAIGLAFKISAVPFHFWAPDVYEGAPIQVTALMSTIVKTAAIAAFYKLFTVSFGSQEIVWSTTLSYIAALSVLIGNIIAVFQSNVKRMLAYSGISHAGYLLLAILANNAAGGTALTYYTLAYSVATIAAFTVVASVASVKGSSDFTSFEGLGKKNKLITISVIVSMMSLAGIPPFAGFFGKYFLFTSYLENHSINLVIIGLIGSAISIYYYFRLIVNLFKGDSEEVIPLSLTTKLVLIVSILLTVALGIFPEIMNGGW